MKNKLVFLSAILVTILPFANAQIEKKVKANLPVEASLVSISKQKLLDKIKGGWAGQTIGVRFGGPREFKYCGTMIPDRK